jgi:flavin reductase ActVB
MEGMVIWGSVELDEEEFVRSFESCEYPNERFKHLDHIRLAWIYVRRFGVGEAENRIANAIRRFAVSLGHEEKYHQTLTKAWLRLVYAAYCATPATDDFGKFIGAHLWLAERNALGVFYSEQLLSSERARRGWIEPDLRSLPSGNSRGSCVPLRTGGVGVSSTEFKTACGLFPTGVTVVARKGGLGTVQAMTVSSFASVSLVPPLALVCIGKQSVFSEWSACDSYTINVLKRDQESLSILFSRRDDIAFDEVQWGTALNGAPVLCGALASLECELRQVCLAGDHCIVLGTVTGAVIGDGNPLVRWRGGYHLVSP